MSAPKRTNAPNENARHGQGGGRKVLGKTNGKGNLTTLGEAALRYARAGYRVVPLKARDKVPRLDKWPTRATADCEQVKAWWAKWPDSNVGLMPPKGCIVVDVDPRNGGSAEGLGLPANTPTQQTGGGGMHYVVRVEKGAELPERDGVDYVHPGKQQFVAEPSVHPSGALYRWRRGLAPWDVQPALWQPSGNAPAASQASAGGSQALAPLPLQRQSLTCDQLRALGQTVHTLNPERWGKGCREAWLTEWLMPVHHETGGSEEGRVLAHEVSALFTGYDRKHLDTEWRSLGRGKPTARTGASLKHALKTMLEGAGQAPHAGELQVYDSTALSAKHLPPLRVLIDGLVTAGLMLLSGQPKVGKSWLVLDLVLALAKGDPFWGHAAKRACGVLYLALEDNERRLKERKDKLWVEGAGDANFKYVLEAPRVGAGLEQMLRSEVRRHRLDLVVIDTLAAVRPVEVRGRSNAWQADYESVQALKRLADELNIAVIVVTHNSKAGSDGKSAQNAIASTGGLTAGVDGYWVIEYTARQTADDQAIAKLTVEHRDLAGGEFAITRNRSTARWEMIGPWGDVVRGNTQREILEALRGNPTGLTAKEISDATGKGASAVAMCLTRMRHQRLIVTTSTGKNKLAR